MKWETFLIPDKIKSLITVVLFLLTFVFFALGTQAGIFHTINAVLVWPGGLLIGLFPTSAENGGLIVFIALFFNIVYLYMLASLIMFFVKKK